MTAVSSAGENPYARSELRPLLRSFTVAAAVAAVCFFMVTASMVKSVLIHVGPSLLPLVPSVATISSEMSDPEVSEITLLIQWLFVPIYLFIWFYFYPPWSLRMRRTVAVTSQALTQGKRTIGLVLGIVFLGSWLLGDFGVINFPTFYNAKYVYPLSEAVPQLRLIYNSRVALTIYAWVGPIAETSIVWMLFVLVLNAKTYLSHKSLQ